MTRVFLVEPYLSGSHQAWADGYQRHSNHEVHFITLPGRFWKWRMFGGALTLANQTRDRITKTGVPDVVLVSDMLDLASFLGHLGRDIGEPKIVLYMHENQLTYPPSPTARDDSAYAYINWSSMARADEVWFNSQFHLDSVFGTLPGFLNHFPDHRHIHLIPAVRQKSRIMRSELSLIGLDLRRKANYR